MRSSKGNSSVQKFVFPKETGVSIGHSLPLISCGTKELAVLSYIQKTGQGFLNKKAISRDLNMARSSVYNTLSRLKMKGLITNGGLHSYKITLEGYKAISIGINDINSSHGGCPKGMISGHHFRYNLRMTKQGSMWYSPLTPIAHKEIEMPNFTKTIFYYEDATIIFNKKTIILNIREIIGSNAEEIHTKCLHKALSYIDKLIACGYVLEGITMDNEHYARVESILSEVLEKIDNRFSLTLDNGHRFWIDRSTGKLEDETDSLEFRQRLDTFIKDLQHSRSTMSDLDSIKQILGSLIKLKAVETSMPICIESPDQKKILEYVG